MRILIIPEIFETAKDWTRVTDILNHIGFNVYVLDYKLPNSDDVEDQTDYAESFLTEKTLVVGDGIGGRIAVQLLARHNHYISGAILLRTPSLKHKSLKQRIKKFLSIFLIPFRIFLSYKTRKKIAEKILEYTVKDKKKKLYRKITAVEQETLLPTIKVPVKLILGSKQRKLHRKIPLAMCKLLRNGECLTVARGAEPLHKSEPKVIANFIDEFARN